MERRKVYEYLKQRKEKFKDQVKRILGSKCNICGREDANRIEFKDISNPDRKKYISNKVTLYRRILDGEINSGEMTLLCGDCWIEHRKAGKNASNS